MSSYNVCSTDDGVVTVIAVASSSPMCESVTYMQCMPYILDYELKITYESRNYFDFVTTISAASTFDPISDIVNPLVLVNLPGGSGPGELADLLLSPCRSPYPCPSTLDLFPCPLPLIRRSPPPPLRVVLRLDSISKRRRWNNVSGSSSMLNKSKMNRRTGA